MSENGPLPSSGTQEYLWWQAGAVAEAKARDEGVNGSVRELRDLLAFLAKTHPEMRQEEMALRAAQICCPEKLRRRCRL